MSGRAWRGMLAVVFAGLMAGCGGGENGNSAAPVGPASGDGKRQVHLVGFDASEPIVNALQQGKIEGVVVQNPLKMGELGVKTLVKHLEKEKVEPKISTGETLVTPENMDEPEIAALINPPRVPNQSAGTLSGAKVKKWRVIVIPKGTTHQFWESLHAGAL